MLCARFGTGLTTVKINCRTNWFYCNFVAFVCFLSEQSEAEFQERHTEVQEGIKAAACTVGLTPPANMKLVLLTFLLLLCTSQGEEPSVHLLF